MKVFESLASRALAPWARVPWGMDRGVSEAEYSRYRRDFQRGVITYFAALIAVEFASPYLPPVLRYAIAILPFAACAFLVSALVRFVAHWDELQRRIMAEAGAVATAFGLGLLLTYNYLEDAGLPHISFKWIAAGFFALWLIALPLVRWYYKA